jgi:DNA adenine methylase
MWNHFGGAGLALELLMDYVVKAIHINDFDRAVYAFGIVP